MQYHISPNATCASVAVERFASCATAAICRDLVRGELFTVGEERELHAAGLQPAGVQARTLLGMYRR